MAGTTKAKRFFFSGTIRIFTYLPTARFSRTLSLIYIRLLAVELSLSALKKRIVISASRSPRSSFPVRRKLSSRAFLSTPFNQFTLARGQRLEGIRKQLESHGLTDGLEVIVEDPCAETDMQDNGLPYEYVVGRRLVAEFLRRKGQATALIGVNDMTALGILNELQAQGFRVPRDYSVCGFDNIFSSSVTTPALTTIDHHLYTRCRSAVDMILSQNEKRSSAQPTMVNKIEYTHQLIVRGSTGPCGAAR